MKPRQARAADRRVPIALALMAGVLSAIALQQLNSSQPSQPVLFAAIVQR